MFTQNAPSHELSLQQLFSLPQRLVADTATYTLAALTNIRNQIVSALPSLSSYDIRVISVNEKSNRVRVGMPSPTDADRDALRQQFGQPIDVFQANPIDATRAYQAPNNPFAAGLNIYPMFEGTPQGICTTGFTTRGRGVRNGKSYRAYYKMTAGHCDPTPGGQQPTYWRRQGMNFSRTVASAVPNDGETGQADAAIFKLPSGKRMVSDKIHVVSAGSTRNYKTVVGTASSLKEGRTEGTRVCISGGSPFARRQYCGHVLETNATVIRRDDDGNFVGRLTDQVSVRFEGTCPVGTGDSGAPVYRQVGDKSARVVGTLNNVETDATGGGECAVTQHGGDDQGVEGACFEEPSATCGATRGNVGYLTKLQNAFDGIDAEPNGPTLSLVTAGG